MQWIVYIRLIWKGMGVCCLHRFYVVLFIFNMSNIFFKKKYFFLFEVCTLRLDLGVFCLINIWNLFIKYVCFLLKFVLIFVYVYFVNEFVVSCCILRFLLEIVVNLNIFCLLVFNQSLFLKFYFLSKCISISFCLFQ